MLQDLEEDISGTHQAPPNGLKENISSIDGS